MQNAEVSVFVGRVECALLARGDRTYCWVRGKQRHPRYPVVAVGGESIMIPIKRPIYGDIWGGFSVCSCRGA